MMSFRVFAFVFAIGISSRGISQDLLAGIGRVDITREGAPAEGGNRLWVKALALSSGDSHSVIVTFDAVATAGIGTIKDPYLANVRAAVKKSLGIDPKSIVVNASHCHGTVTLDVEKRTIDAITAAWSNRVQENRRIELKNGKTTAVRHAYALPPNSEIAAVGPIDPEIGITDRNLLTDRIFIGASVLPGLRGCIVHVTFDDRKTVGTRSATPSAIVSGISSEDTTSPIANEWA